MDFFFAMSKAVALVLLPGNFLALLVLIAGALCLLRRSRRWGFRIGFGAAALFLLIGVLPVGPWMLRALERCK